MKISFIGAGNMGYPLLKGALKAFGAENLTFQTKHREHEGALSMAKEKIIVSVMAGITVEELKQQTGAVKIVRAMPNTPAMLGEGMTCISYSNEVTEVEKEVMRRWC